MSLLNQFSFIKSKGSSKNLQKSSSVSDKLNIRTDILKSEAAYSLIKLGYSLEILMNLLKVNYFETVDEALNLLEKDPDTHKYNHKFYLKKENNNKLCCICNSPLEEHIDNNILRETSSNFNQFRENSLLMRNKNNSIKNNEKIDKYYIDFDICDSNLQNNLKKSNTNIKNLANMDDEIYNNLNKCQNNNENVTINNYNKFRFNENKDEKNNSSSQINLISDGNNFHLDLLNNNNNISTKIDKFKTSNNDFQLSERKNNTTIDNNNKLIKTNKTSNQSCRLYDVQNSFQNELLKPNNLKNTSPILNSNQKKNPQQNLFKYGKIVIPSETLELFQDPDICRICFAEKVNKNNIAQKTCNHFFCDNCIRRYLESNIINGKVLGISCLMGGCPKLYNDEEIKENTTPELFRKYKKFYNEQIKLNHPDILYVHCPYPDCEEIVNCDEEESEFVKCANGHEFCFKCHQLGRHKNGECKNDEEELLNQIQKANKNGSNFKQCPQCKVIIEKNEGCNQMHCINCGYDFCWLCLKRYSEEHYALYNVTGCPGMRFESDSGSKWTRNPCLKILWYIFSCFLGFLALILVFLFYLFCGCPYEFIKCYTKKKDDDDDDDEDGFGIDIGNNNNNNEIQQGNCDIEQNNQEGNNNNNTQTQAANNKIKDEKREKWKIILIGFLGFLCQPLYLMFYILYGLMECYRRFNCWFYYIDH